MKENIVGQNPSFNIIWEAHHFFGELKATIFLSPGKNTEVAMPSFRSSQPRDQTQVSRIEGRFFTVWATREAHLSLAYLYK